jgi:cell division protein ZapE
MIQNIIDNLKNQGIEIDLAQSNLIKKMIESIPKEKSLINKFKKRKFNKASFYIWGEVGRGKTLITKSFLNEIKINKAIFHYIDFMQNIHNELSVMSGKSDPLNLIAKSLSKKYKIIFIDEFQVEDVADAMIIGNLLNQLIQLDVVLYITSNAHPDDLYKDGLQRQKFIDVMKAMQKQFNIYKLDGVIDYRSRNIANVNQEKSNKFFDEKDILLVIKENFDNKNFTKKTLNINSRQFTCKAVSNDFLWISFSDFFIEPNGSSDYMEISKNTEWVFLNDFKYCDDNSTDIIRRFISFIDICYRDKTKIKFFFNGIAYEKLYTGNKLEILWDRCQSRLSEMQTSEYLI